MNVRHLLFVLVAITACPNLGLSLIAESSGPPRRKVPRSLQPNTGRPTMQDALPIESEKPLPKLDKDSMAIDVEALIDGRDHLVIQGGMVQWRHHDWAIVGRHEPLNEPTVISTKKQGAVTLDRFEWFPEWRDLKGKPVSHYRQPAVSSKFNELTPPFPSGEMEVLLTPIRYRGAVRIVQQPRAENDYALVVEFDDNAYLGAVTYKIRLTVRPGRRASREADSRATRLSVQLRDGSRILGTADASLRKVISESQEEMEIPLLKIREIRFEDQGKKVNISLADGHSLQASLSQAEFELTTLLGKVKIPTEKIARICNLGARDLVAYFPLDGSLSDRSGNENNASANGDVAFADGVRGQAVSLDGIQDFIEIPNHHLLNSESTVAFWVKVSDSGDYSLVSKALLGNGYGIWLGRDANFNQGKPAGGLPSFGFDGSGTQWNWHLISADGAIRPNHWHHVAAVLSHSRHTLYVDGKERASSPSVDTPAIDAPIWLGREMRLGGGYLNGLLDEVHIYGRPLSSREVGQLYKEHAPSGER